MTRQLQLLSASERKPSTANSLAADEGLPSVHAVDAACPPRDWQTASANDCDEDVHEVPTVMCRVPQTGISGEHRMPPLVLIADDNPDSRAMYAEYLAYVGLRVLVAGNGEEAVRLALQARPDLILMDVMMPQVDGYEATRMLRADERTRGTIIVAVTCLDRSGAEAQMREAGCDLLVTKPFLPDDLERLVSGLLETRGPRAVMLRK